MCDKKLEYHYVEGGVEVLSGPAYIAYQVMGGSGTNTVKVESGLWQRGVGEDLIAVCATEAEADQAIDEYMAR